MYANHHRQTLLAVLTDYRPFDENEAQHLARLREFLQTCERPFSRAHAAGHVTASAVITNRENTHLLLIWHEKLQRWLQPGGHCEPDIEKTTQDAALRELLEETLLPAEKVSLVRLTPFDVDVHEIPARGDEPTHWHYDVRYWFATTVEVRDTQAYQWKPIEDVARIEEVSLSRMAKKLLSPSNLG